MKLLSKAFIFNIFVSTLVFAEPCPEGEYCYSVDMSSVKGAYKETLCTESDHLKQCSTAVWVPVNKESFIDLNSFRIDEEDVFINYKIIMFTNSASRPMTEADFEFYRVDHVRFDCERGVYKLFYTEYRTKKQLIEHKEVKNKPEPVKGNQWLESIYNRTCMAHNALTKD